MPDSALFPGSKIAGPADIIAISGFAGSGKNTVGGQVAKRLGWRMVEPTFKTLAAREGISLMQFQQKAKQDPDIDKKFDAALQEECAGGKCVVSTWLGPWMAPGKPFRVWLDVKEEVRAKRLTGRDGMDLPQAASHIRQRDADNRVRYKKVYGIDISSHAGFDLVIRAEAKSPSELADEIIQAYHKRLI
ncbi:Cytidylate kinase [uncultured archaeon]|nr:Cytidylate kinase [uncultured archaeon]